MEVAHCQRDLLTNVDNLIQAEDLRPQMDVFVECLSLAEAGHDGKVGWSEAGSHEECQVLVACLL